MTAWGRGGEKAWPPAQFSIEFSEVVSRKMHGEC